jgi:zinc finger CCHC domain-containing protein 8
MASVAETSAGNITADNILETGSFIVVDECISDSDETTKTCEEPKNIKESSAKKRSRSKSRDINTRSVETIPITPTAFIKKPLIYVSFNEKSTFDSHRESFVRFLESKLKTFKNRNCEVKEDSEIYTIEIVDKSINKTSMFMVDKTPTSKKTSVDIPNYAASSDVLDHNSKESCEKKKMRNQRPANTCFNCDGPHSLRDCPKPKNMSKINKARGSFNKRAERYHCDIEQKFGHIKPGRPSIGLREALGIENHDIPMYIYGMRTLGYPPAWLNDAKITHSGINLFDSEVVFFLLLLKPLKNIL